MGRIRCKTVTCIDCGKTERVRVIGKHRVLGDWIYGGTMDINTCKTSKYFYKMLPNAGPGNEWKTERVLNKSYDPKIKRKYRELWLCKQCSVPRSKLSAPQPTRQKVSKHK